MGYPTKIATCCHCGSKAALTLDAGRHELSCASCGAPLHDLKRIPKDQKQQERKRGAISHKPQKRQFAEKPAARAAKKTKPRKVKRRKSWFESVTEELFDLVEDIFD
ncbi:MAG: hypothetical protein ABJL67_23020 [Sulfitobacter sp.]